MGHRIVNEGQTLIHMMSYLEKEEIKVEADLDADISLNIGNIRLTFSIDTAEKLLKNLRSAITEAHSCISKR